MTSRTSELTVVPGRRWEMEGKLTVEGQILIDGKFSGQITTKDTSATVVISEGANVNAKITAGSVIVQGGQVHGEIRAVHLVELHKPSRVTALIEAPELSIERGVFFEGVCKMQPDSNLLGARSAVADAPPRERVAAGAK